MAFTASGFASFKAQLPRESLLLLEQVAAWLEDIVRRKLGGRIDKTHLIRAVSTAMPSLSPDEAQGLTACALELAAGVRAKSAQMMKVQMAMQRENQIFTSVSNVLRTRHDTVKNSIGN